MHMSPERVSPVIFGRHGFGQDTHGVLEGQRRRTAERQWLTHRLPGSSLRASDTEGMYVLHTWKTPNGRKPCIFLNEATLDYRLELVDVSKERSQAFLELNPNGKIPVLVDAERNVTVFESAAILLYLAEVTGRFLPPSGPERARVVQWLIWQAASVSPIVEQLGHFLYRAEKLSYPIDRFADACLRVMRVLDQQLASCAFVAGEYSIADMGLYPFARVLWEPLCSLRPKETEVLDRVDRWLRMVGERPAVQAAFDALA
jgi:GST-like protein